MDKRRRRAIIVTGFGLIFVAVILFIYAVSRPEISLTLVDSSAADNKSEQLSSVSDDIFVSDETVFSTVGESSTETGPIYSSGEAEQTTAAQTYENDDTSVNVSFPLNLNTCTAEELKAIDGIGDARANAIIEYRKKLGKYTSVEQIKDISGIGDAIYSSISPYLTV